MSAHATKSSENVELIATNDISDTAETSEINNDVFSPLEKSVYIPKTRYNYLKENWKTILELITKKLKLQIRYNLKTKYVDLRTCEETESNDQLTTGASYIEAIAKGFNIADSVVLIRLPNIALDSIDIGQQKLSLKGNSFSRAIGRIAGRSGSTLYSIENATKTRMVLNGKKVHFMGTVENIQIAKTCVQNLIIGSPANKVYGNLKNMVSKASSKV